MLPMLGSVSSCTSGGALTARVHFYFFLVPLPRPTGPSLLGRASSHGVAHVRSLLGSALATCSPAPRRAPRSSTAACPSTRGGTTSTQSSSGRCMPSRCARRCPSATPPSCHAALMRCRRLSAPCRGEPSPAGLSCWPRLALLASEAALAARLRTLSVGPSAMLVSSYHSNPDKEHTRITCARRGIWWTPGAAGCRTTTTRRSSPSSTSTRRSSRWGVPGVWK